MSDTISNRNSYGNILKSIGLFGGVKVFQILVGIIKNKFVAVLLGPVGMGISGMITSTTSFVNACTSFGLHTSSVREIAKSYSSRNDYEISRIATVLRKLVLITGALGTILTFLLAPILSQWSFGNDDYTMAFRIVFVILFFDQITTGQTALLQGTFHYKYMAKSGLLGSVIGLVVSVPLYYIWGVKAIVPVIIVSSLTSLILSWYYSRKLSIKSIPLSLKDILVMGKGMIVLGFAIALSGILNTGKVYILRSFISNYGTIADVGLYTAGIAISTQYIDVILQSMGTDYSPRLAALSNDVESFIEAVNRQTKLLITIVTPLLIPFIVLIKQLTWLLYSDKFVQITGMIEWMMFGMFFRTMSWCLSYTIVAKGEAKKYFWNEFATSIYSLAFSIIGYKFAGFTGLGMAFCLTYLFYTVHMFIVCRKLYGFSYRRDVIRIFALQFSVIAITFISLKILDYSIWRYLIGFILFLFNLAISYKILNKMIPVRESVSNFIKSRKK